MLPTMQCHSRRVLAAGIFRASIGFITECLPHASAAGAQASLCRAHTSAECCGKATRPPSRTTTTGARLTLA